MAIPRKPAPKGEVRAVSMDPDSFVSGGLHTNFDGVVKEARTAIWNYDNGNGPKLDEQGNPIFGSFAKLVIVDKEDGAEYTNYYSAAYVDSFVPSLDGVNPCERDPETGCCEGIFFIPAEGSTKTALGLNTNYAQLLTDLRTAGFKEQFKANIDSLEGIAGHWDRVPVRKKGGAIRVQEESQGGRKRNDDVLVCTRYDGREEPPAGGVKAQPKTGQPAPTPKQAAAQVNAGGDAGLDEKLTAIVQASLPTDGTPINARSLAGKVMPNKTLTAMEKSKGVKRIVSTEFLNAGMEQEPPAWLFDADEGTVQAYIE